MALIPFNHRKKHDLSIKDDFFNMVNDFFNDNLLLPRNFTNDAFKIDIEEKDKEYIISAELPGINKEDICLDFSDGHLLIKVERNQDVEDKDKNYVHRERRHTSMSRSIYLVDGIADGIKAKLNEGILKIIVPKQEQKRDDIKKIEIE